MNIESELCDTEPVEDDGLDQMGINELIAYIRENLRYRYSPTLRQEIIFMHEPGEPEVPCARRPTIEDLMCPRNDCKRPQAIPEVMEAVGVGEAVE